MFIVFDALLLHLSVCVCVSLVLCVYLADIIGSTGGLEEDDVGYYTKDNDLEWHMRQSSEQSTLPLLCGSFMLRCNISGSTVKNVNGFLGQSANIMRCFANDKVLRVMQFVFTSFMNGFMLQMV